MAIESINPATGALLRTFPALTDEAIQQRLALAAEAFTEYRRVPLANRTLCMRKLASLLDYESEDLATLITSEMGKPLTASRLEIAQCAAVCRYFADHATHILAPEVIPTPQHHSFVRWEPLGPILAVMPWDYPFWQVFRFLAPALMAGNVALLKHAPNVPQCALALESLVRRAGFPRGTLQALLVEVAQVESILVDRRIAAVTVTGGYTAGRTLGAHATWLVKKSVLELGGSDPFVVMPSADVESAANIAVQAACVNSGQSAIAARRILVAEEIYEEFEARFVDGIDALRVGDPMQEQTDLGPLATVAVLRTVETQIRSALDAGARLLTGGARMLGKGNYFEPTVLGSVPRNAAIFHEEIFGPVSMLFPVRNLDEAIELANDTPFGLGASVWTRDPAEQQRLVAELQCGMVYVNAMVVSDPNLPFGGIKRSGIGRELSAAGMREFLNAKTVVIAEQTPPAPDPDKAPIIPYEPFTAEDFDDLDRSEPK